MLSRTVQTQLTRVLLMFVVAGFALLLAELLMIGHTFNTLQMIAVGSSAVGLILSLLSFVVHTGLRRLITVLFMVLSLVGLFGFYTHFSSRARRQELAATAPATDDRVLQRALNTFRRNPPLVPPLALSGLSALAVVTLLGAPAGARETRVDQPRLNTARR